MFRYIGRFITEELQEEFTEIQENFYILYTYIYTYECMHRMYVL